MSGGRLSVVESAAFRLLNCAPGTPERQPSSQELRGKSRPSSQARDSSSSSEAREASSALSSQSTGRAAKSSGGTDARSAGSPHQRRRMCMSQDPACSEPVNAPEGVSRWL